MMAVCAKCGGSMEAAFIRGHGTRSKYCGRTCYAEGKRRTLESRFWKYSDRSGGPDACWTWIASKCPRGYGRLGTKVGHRIVQTKAHRLSYEIAHGVTPPADLVVMHLCDNPSCVNPRHLALGTQAENVADMFSKGRQKPRNGEASPHAKLTDSDVLALRAAHEAGVAIAPIAKRIGVASPTAWNAIKRKTWKHIP